MSIWNKNKKETNFALYLFFYPFTEIIDWDEEESKHFCRTCGQSFLYRGVRAKKHWFKHEIDYSSDYGYETLIADLRRTDLQLNEYREAVIKKRDNLILSEILYWLKQGGKKIV